MQVTAIRLVSSENMLKGIKQPLIPSTHKVVLGYEGENSKWVRRSWNETWVLVEKGQKAVSIDGATRGILYNENN